MLKNTIEVGTVIQTKLGEGRVRRIGEIAYGERSKYGWCMVTLDVAGEVVYCVAREDELKFADNAVSS